jgi:hypothetical protein
VYSLHTLVTVSDDGGKTFRTLVPFRDVHPDHHALWLDPTDPRRLLLGNDGGVAESRDRGETWRFVANLPVGQFYHLDVDLDVPYHRATSPVTPSAVTPFTPALMKRSTTRRRLASSTSPFALNGVGRTEYTPSSFTVDSSCQPPSPAARVPGPLQLWIGSRAARARRRPPGPRHGAVALVADVWGRGADLRASSRTGGPRHGAVGRGADRRAAARTCGPRR